MFKIFIFLLLVSVSTAGNFTISSDNDLWGKESDDQHYTHGSLFSISTTNVFEWAYTDFASYVIGKPTRTTYNLGQYIYTPSDIETSELLPEDRRYGGLLYIGYALYADTEFQSKSLEIDVGVTGPASLAEKTQKAVHNRSGAQTPNGWHNQLSGKMALNMTYQNKNKIFKVEDAFDVILYYGGSFGNINTFVNSGGSARIGLNIPNDFNMVNMEPIPRSFMQSVSLYGILSCEGKAVAYNAFLSGVDPEILVGEYAYGIGGGVKNISVTYTHSTRSKEFTNQESDNNIGNFTVSFTF